MKSLGKHLEAGPVDQLHLSPREEMETNLIRSLIASYFGIVRQTIEDLVPKAIMHLLVSRFYHSSYHTSPPSELSEPRTGILVFTLKHPHGIITPYYDCGNHTSSSHHEFHFHYPNNVLIIRSISRETPSSRDW